MPYLIPLITYIYNMHIVFVQSGLVLTALVQIYYSINAGEDENPEILAQGLKHTEPML